MACEECTMRERISALEEDSKKNAEAHREFYGKFEQMKVDNAVANNNMMNITSTLSEIRADVKELKEKPAKRYDAIVMYIITSVLGALVGFLINGVMPH